MNFYKLFLLSVNISLVFCLEPIQECKFLNAYSSYYLDDNGCCFSENVKCDISQGHIVSIDLRNSIKQDMRNKFSLEKFLNQFPSLKRINISENELTGDFIIPNNTTLVELNASNNSFNGKLVIPDNSEIDSFFNDGECRLQILNISNNEFKGDLNIPDNSTLVMLDASNNHFNGYLNIGENTELEELNVSNNEFKEEFLIPPHTNLKTLDVSDNLFYGDLQIPKSSKLKILFANNNMLSGELIIPENQYLEKLHAINNKLKGEIYIPKNTNLKELYLRNNKFESYPCDTVIENDFQDCHINLENFMCTVIPILAIIIIGFAMVMIKKFGNANENNKETQNNDDQTDELTVKVEDSN